MATKYALPELNYDYAALEPHISGRIMELHHGKHHAAYVKGLNDVLEQIGESRQKEDWSRLPAQERALAFHLSGHILHSIFWGNLTPRGGGRPGGPLTQALDRDLGGFDRFRAQMNQAAATVMGSGWAALVWEPTGGRLLVTQIYDHQSNLAQGGLPIMVMDAWEHAFYLQYENRKTDFFAALWNVWDWEDIGRRYEAVSQVGLAPSGGAGR